MVVTVLAVLLLLLPRNSFLSSPERIGRPDALSVAYLQALLRADQTNDAIRMLYAEHLAAVGRIREAERELAMLGESTAIDARRRTFLAMRLAVQRLVLDPDDGGLLQRTKKLLRQGMAMSGGVITPGQWSQVADQLLQAGQPALAARVFVYLAAMDKANQEKWLEHASRWYLASGDALRAGFLRMRLFSLHGRMEDGQKAVAAFHAAQRPDEAFKAMKMLILHFPEDRGLVLEGLRLAISEQHFALGRSWGTGWLGAHPEDEQVMQLLVELELASSHPRDAFPWASRLVELNPEAVGRHEQLARIAEWTGRTETAYRERRWLVAHRHDRRDLRRALTLANALHDYPAVKGLLDQAAREYGLSVQERADLARVLELLGAPRQSEQARMAYLRRHPDDRKAWVDLAHLQEYLGKLRESARTWARIERRFGQTEETVIQRARMLSLAGDPDQAFELTRSFAEKDNPQSPEFWRVHGDLAWNLEYHNEAFSSYRWLWDHGLAGSLESQRLMILLREQGDYATTLRISEQAWNRFHDPDVLLLAIESAIQTGYWKDAERLMRIADAQPSRFRDRRRYWLAHARLQVYRNRLMQAESDYWTALSLSPDDAEARAGLLWVWIQSAQRKKLKLYLRRWQADALRREVYWQAYAAANRMLGRHRASLPWFEQYARAHPRDRLWMLEYADALADAGQATGAWRLRRHLFLQLGSGYAEMESPVGQEAVSRLLLEIRGRPSADAWVVRLLHDKHDPMLEEFALRWYFGYKDHPLARYWLLRRHAARLETPAWQELALAMRQNDLHRMERLLDRSPGLDHVSRLLAERQLLHLDRAWNMALASNLGTGDFTAPERQTMLRQARDIAALSPNAIHVVLGFDHFGSLTLNHQAFKVFRSRSNLSLFLHGGQTHLVPGAGIAGMSGSLLEFELQLGGRYRHRHGESLGYIGINERMGGVNWNDRLWQAGGRLQWFLWQGTELGVDVARNETGLETSRFRLVGARDRLGLSLHSDLTQREFVAARLNLNRHFSRTRDPLARGHALDATLGHRLQMANSLAEEQIQLRISGEWIRNRLEPSLGGYAGAVLPGTAPESVIPASFASLGVGLNIRKDRPGNDEAVARTPIYEFDAWLGWQTPGSGPAYSLSLAAGIPVLGRDMLSLRAYVANSFVGSISRESLYGLSLWYSYRFGK
ncbi:MAG: hypothetical protein D6790_18705 [Caldilineae bacterium]|nr:MAG: hypothetical protein D6790_18705 [Caldilineae bacterium]